ncbi:MAG TPA: TPM domain-containing protein, partial [Saprospiraceae bacterium]|nr:TPM domain-containing protein [Saprospiraceae bacterium]
MTRLFSTEEEARIIDAIREAEQQTSGEVRVHVEKNLRGDAMKEAIRTFRKLGMHRTAQRNGVLIFLAPERRELV